MKTLNDKWKEFDSMVISKQAHAIQRQEMKRAFFGGASSVLDLLLNEVADLPDGEAEKALQSLQRQCQGFVEAVKLGVA